MFTLPRTRRNIKAHYPRRFLGYVPHIISEVARKNGAASWLNQGFSPPRSLTEWGQRGDGDGVSL